jgi:hypothetical protein
MDETRQPTSSFGAPLLLIELLHKAAKKSLLEQQWEREPRMPRA